MEDISLNAFEKSIVSGIKPKFKKPVMKIKKSDYRILSITELITKNFNKNKTSDITGYFVINVNGTEHKVIVNTVTIKVLEAVFRTTGRLPDEMKAVCFFQAELINNIAKIQTRKKLIAFLESIKTDSKTAVEIKDTLLRLCKSGYR